MDRNFDVSLNCNKEVVALRKESVDRNDTLSALAPKQNAVALRKESVDRNVQIIISGYARERSLSARRAWIEIAPKQNATQQTKSRSPQGERG